MVVLVVERGTDVVVGGEMAYFLFRIGTRAPIEGTAFSAQFPQSLEEFFSMRVRGASESLTCGRADDEGARCATSAWRGGGGAKEVEAGRVRDSGRLRTSRRRGGKEMMKEDAVRKIASIK